MLRHRRSLLEEPLGELIHPHDTRDFAGAKAAVFIDDRIVTIQRDDNARLAPRKLDLIGGRREGNETPLQTIAREGFEEAGLHLDVGALVLHAERFSHEGLDMDNREGSSDTNCGVFMVIRVGDPRATPRLGDEGEAIYMLSPSQYLSRTDAWLPYQHLTERWIRQGLEVEW